MAEPYKVFFRFGWVMTILFLGVWPLYTFFHIIPYPGPMHVQGTVSLAIGSFAIGFLLTAMPRFTETPSVSLGAVISLFTLSILELAVLLLGFTSLAALFLAAKFLGIFVFAAPRFVRRKNPIPPSFVWIGFAILYAALGGIGSWFSPTSLFTSFLTQGFMTSLFLGVGGKLIPVLTGVSGGVIVEKKYSRYEMKIHALLAALFFVGLYFQHVLGLIQWGMTLKAIVLFVEIGFLWKLYKTPSRSSRAYLLWIAAWLLPTTQGLSVPFPTWNLHIEHIMFIGTFLVGTIAVASHVIVSHQRLDQSLLIRGRPLGVIGVLLFLAGLTRVIAPFLSYEKHLGYAGLVAVSALLYWGFQFFWAKPALNIGYEEC